MADDTTPQDPAPEAPEQQQPDQQQEPETGEPVKAEKSVPLADLVKERKERQRLTKELEQLRTASLSDTERAIAEAEKRGAQQASERYASRLVDEAFRAASAGRALNPDAALSFDRGAFITDDGDVDRDGLVQWVEKNSSLVARRPTGDVGQGARGSTPEPSDPKSLADAVQAARGF